MPFGIQRSQNMARRSVHLVVELTLNAAEAGVVGADVTQNLRGQIVVRIKALELLLKVNALQVQLPHPRRRLRIQAACHPREVARCIEPRQHLGLRRKVIACIRVHNLCQKLCCVFTILAKLARNGVDAVDQHCHRQFL
jgi:hypothetical protein